MRLDHPCRCPRCGQPVAARTVLFPVSNLSLAERLIWRELASVEGAVVPLGRLERYTASDNGLKIHIFYLRRKTGRTIRSVWGEGYVLEPEREAGHAASP
jgi:DNA-binding response OmpR family regulator